MKKGNKYYNKNGDLLDSNLQVWSAVEEFNDKKEPVWFSKLVEYFEDNLTRTEISKAQDRLYDCGVLDTKYIKVGKMWTCCWFIDDIARGWIKRDVL